MIFVDGSFGGRYFSEVRELMEVNSGCFIFLMNDDDHEDEWESYFMPFDLMLS